MNPIPPPLDTTRKPQANIVWLPLVVLTGTGLVVYLLAIVLCYEQWGLAAVLVALLGLIVWQVRRRPVYLVGPLFFCEIIRLARKGRTTVLRCLYALALFGGLWSTYEVWLRSPPFSEEFRQEFQLVLLRRLAEDFSLSILVVQNVAVLLLTPLYISTCIQDERRRGTLEMLLGTHLYDNEIIIGKMLARVAMIGLLVLTGVPVLALIQFWGGTNPYLVVGGFFLTAFTLLHTGSICIFCSVISRSSIESLFKSYIIIAITMFGFLYIGINSYSPITSLMALDSHLTSGSYSGLADFSPVTESPTEISIYMIGHFGFYHLAMSVLFLKFAISNLRSANLKIPPKRLGSAEVHESLVFLEVEGNANNPTKTGLARWRSWNQHWPEDEHPLWQREAACSQSIWYDLLYLEMVVVTCSSIVIGILFLWIFFSTQHGNPTNYLEGLNRVFRVLATLFFAGFAVSEAFRTTGCISREREQRTLTSLLLLPGEWRTLLRIKWLAGWRQFQVPRRLLFYFTFGIVAHSVFPLGAVLCLIAGAVHLLFFSSLGLWLSLVCRTTLQANLIMGCLIFSLIILPFMVLSPDPSNSTFLAAVNPVACLYSLCFSWEEFADPKIWERIALAMSGVLVYGGLTWLLWGWSCRLFIRNPLKNT